MKNGSKILRDKWFVILIVGFGFILAPTLTIEMTNAQEISINNTTSPQKNTAPSIYDLLIIAPKQFVKALQPLIVHKNAMNVRTCLVTIDEVYQQMFWHGRDKPEKIKYFIKTAKEEWGITYVMLVGGFLEIPVRYVFNADNNTFWMIKTGTSQAGMPAITGYTENGTVTLLKTQTSICILMCMWDGSLASIKQR
jgi:hypothetical protein